MATPQDYLPVKVLRELQRQSLDIGSLTWSIEHSGDNVTLKLQWKKIGEGEKHKDDEKTAFDSDTQHAPASSGISSWNAEKETFRRRDRNRLSLKGRKTWSQYRTEKEKVRENGLNRISPQKTAVASGNGPGRCVVDEGQATPTCKYSHREETPVKKIKMDDSPQILRDALSWSNSSASGSQDSSGNTSPWKNATPKNQVYAFFPHSRTKKKLTFVKVEEPSDDELSDSLPDLEEISSAREQDFVQSPPVLQAYPNDCFTPESCSEILGGRNDEMPTLVIEEDQTLNNSDSRIATPKCMLNLKEKLSTLLISGTKIGDIPKKKDRNSNGAHKIAERLDRAMDSESDSRPSSGDGRHFLDILACSPAKKIKLVSGGGKTYGQSTESGLSEAVPPSDVIRNNQLGNVFSSEAPVMQRQSPSDHLNIKKLKSDNPKDPFSPDQNRRTPVLNSESVACSPDLDAKVLLTRARAPPSGGQGLEPVQKAPPVQTKYFDFVKSRQQDSEVNLLRRQFFLRKPRSKPVPVLSISDFAKKNSKILYPSLVTDFALPEELVGTADQRTRFTATQVNAVEAAMEEGECFMNHVVDLAQVFSCHSMPPESIVSQIFQVGLLDSSSVCQSFKVFNCLSYIQRKYPSAVKVNWKLLTDIMERLGLTKASLTTDPCSILNCCLGLQLIIQVFHGELRTMDLSDPVSIQRSQAYRMLSGDHELNHLKQLTDWISRVITCGEYDELCESYLNIQLEGDKAPSPNWQWPDGVNPEEVRPSAEERKRVLPYLQQLLEVAILVSTSNIDCARRLASDFVQIFKYCLPNLDHKKLLLRTMSSDLLRFKLCQLFMEAHCDMAPCCTDFPPTLDDVMDCVFRATPPKSQHTPPMTPTDDEDFEELDLPRKVSPESCEQLCMLQYYALFSYIQCAKSQCNKALRRRGSRDEISYKVNEIDRQTLQHGIEECVESLRMALVEASGGITPFTEHYLLMMKSLA